MNTQPEILASLRQLRLPHMADRLVARPLEGEQSEEFFVILNDLLRGEIDDRAQRVLLKRQRGAGINMPSASLEGVWYRQGRNLSRAIIEALEKGDYLDRGQHVIITGRTGRGKTWLANALAQTAIRQGRDVLYRDVPELLAEWQAADLAGKLPSFRRKLQRLDLLVLDDWAVEPLVAEDVHTLRRILLERSEQKSIMLVSPADRDHWRQWIGGYVGDALMDRIEGAACRIDLEGPSFRKSPSTI